MFLNRRGAHLTRTMILIMIKRLAAEAGIKKTISPHTLRHSFATRCIESRCDYKTVSMILGHANITTTMNLYVHPGNDQKRKCIDKMMRMLC